MREKRFYINTIGCQMNVHDSERIAALMQGCGYRQTPFPEGADLIFLNTCAIREKAEQKVFSFLGRLAALKKRNPDLIIAACGCVAQQEADRILERMAHVDLVLGTHSYGRLPKIIEEIHRNRRRIVDVDVGETLEEIRTFFSQKTAEKAPGVSRFVTIMQGCDNYCAYCVVPFVRGRERSRDPEEIVFEIQYLVAAGVREVTLLGQNVNSFGKKEGIASFSELLAGINKIEGLERIRFTTSHPKDLSDDLVAAFGRFDKLCRHIHLPVQSGSDRVLSRMHRRYTRAHYIDRVKALRSICPDISITTDFIVGFPGESEDDFQETLSMMAAVEFDSLFAFKYSDRKGTRAAGLMEKVPESIKTERLKTLFEFQRDVTLKKYRALVGTFQEVLVDGPSKKTQKQTDSGGPKGIQWTGRTLGNKIVNFRVNGESPFHDVVYPGALVCVHIKQAFANSLEGEAPECRPGRFEEIRRKHSCCIK